MKKTNYIVQILMILAVLIGAASVTGCEKDPQPAQPSKVFLIYSAGHNSLREDLADDIKDLTKAYNGQGNSSLLIYTHKALNSKYESTPSYLIKATPSKKGVKLDTLVTYPETSLSASAEMVTEVLNYVHENFKAEEYGMLFSSHGTGYLPAGYYSQSATFERNYTAAASSSSLPKKTIGQEWEGKTNYEIDIKDFTQAIPFKLDYLLFDACLMGGVEVAYQLRDKTRYLVASPTEIISDGMDYRTMTNYVFSNEPLKIRLIKFCQNYYEYYNRKTGEYKSATISLVDMEKLEPLAQICKSLFSKYQNYLDALDSQSIQRYYSYAYHWFYDLEDIVSKIGCSKEEKNAFDAAMLECIIYKNATETFLARNKVSPYPGFVIDKNCGLSMCLPCDAGAYLLNYYKSLDWNIATELVK